MDDKCHFCIFCLQMQSGHCKYLCLKCIVVGFLARVLFVAQEINVFNKPLDLFFFGAVIKAPNPFFGVH